MNRRRAAGAVTIVAVGTMAALLLVPGWGMASRIAIVVSALAAVAAVGVAVWAALPAASSGSEAGVRVSRTGRAVTGSTGQANSGVTGPASAMTGPVQADRTGDASASGGGDANTGVQLS